MKEKSKEEMIKNFTEFWTFVSSYAPNTEVKEKFKTNIPSLIIPEIKNTKPRLFLVKTEE